MPFDAAMPVEGHDYLDSVKTRHGNWRYYVRVSRKAKRIALPGHPDASPENKLAYHRALAIALAGKEVPKPGKASKDSLRWLIQQWKQSSDFILKAPATKRQRENILKHIIKRNGNLPYSGITKAVVAQGRERRLKTPFAANNYLKTVKALFAWALDSDLIAENPAIDVAFLSVESEGHEPWTHDDLEKYRQKHPEGTRARVALETIYFTGLRRGDACRLGKQHIGKDGMVRLRMEKTKRTVTFAIHPYLAWIWQQGPVGDLAFIVNERGKPYTKESFGNAFRDWCRDAEITKSAHGLRKLAASEAAEGGSTEEQLQKLFGWHTLGQSAVYTRAARADELSRAAGEKRAGNMAIPKPDAAPDEPKKLEAKS